MKFINNANKLADKTTGMDFGAAEPPRYWLTTGNYALNRIMTGTTTNGIGQGRLMSFSGPSGAGKSYLTACSIRESQKQGAYCIAIDSENALDDDFLTKVGVDTSEDKFAYYGVITIGHAVKIMSNLVNGYKDEYSEDLDKAPKLLIVVDSLDMMMTDTEYNHSIKGENKGDQGQRNKQLKAMLRSWVQMIKDMNISIIVTSQVYKNQDLLNGEGVWIISDAVRYSLSQIVLLTKLKLKDAKGGAGDFSGVRIKCSGFKTRFTKPFQSVTLEVPYNTGLATNEGLVGIAVELGVLKKSGAWLSIASDPESPKFYARDVGKYEEQVVKECQAKGNVFLQAADEDEDHTTDSKDSMKVKRLKNLAESMK